MKAVFLRIILLVMIVFGFSSCKEDPSPQEKMLGLYDCECLLIHISDNDSTFSSSYTPILLTKEEGQNVYLSQPQANLFITERNFMDEVFYFEDFLGDNEFDLISDELLDTLKIQVNIVEERLKLILKGVKFDSTSANVYVHTLYSCEGRKNKQL